MTPLPSSNCQARRNILGTLGICPHLLLLLCINPIWDSGNLLPHTLTLLQSGHRLAPLDLEMFRRAWRTKKRTIWIVYFRLKEKMNSAKAAGNSSMDFCLFLTQYATDDGRRQLCTVLALMNFSYDGFFFFENFLAAMGWISPGGRSNTFWNLAPKQNSPHWSKKSCLLSLEAWSKLVTIAS